ncbi:MAG: hypothetical protein K8T90_18165 [Planctomycetes bacterium]|nr:hypothetical protein [Planctomycetota bacterium]
MHRTRPALAVAFAALAALSSSAAAAPDGPAAPAAPGAPAAPPKLAAWQYPKEISVAGRKMFLNEPQVLGRDNATGEIKLRFAASILDGAGRITWGMVEAAGTSHLDLTSRLVLVDGIKSGASALPQLAEKERDDVTKALPDALPKDLLLRLELVTNATVGLPVEAITPPKFSMSPPELLVRRTPAVLVQIDGEPVKEPVADFPFEYVLNTSSDLFRDPKADTWYLLVDGSWLEAKALQGPWKAAAQVPILLTQLPVTHPRGHIRAWIPGTQEFTQRTGGKKPVPPTSFPEILVREKPAELVLLEGDPLFMMVPGVKLLVVANTASDMLYHPKSAQFFLLVAGRWFVADDAQGPWKEAAGALPEEFAKIPRDHVRAHVLWNVPGTPESAEAAAVAAIEERITLTRATSISIQFADKEPRLVPIEGTDVKVVTNCDDEVFVTGGAWWCCARGVWFKSDDGKTNWAPATQVPKALDGIPEAGGAFQVRDCRAVGAVEAGFRFGVTGGYSGLFTWKGLPLYGTGYTRRGLARNGNWYPYPRTWGENRWYDPVAGAFQPRTVTYTADMKGVATEWSPYTASYGRVRGFADRYSQGGRRAFPWTADSGKFDLSAPRPDPFETWGTQIKERDGVPAASFPLGDRTSETSSKELPVVADPQGLAWRMGEKGPETWKDARWQAPDPKAGESLGAEEKRWLETFARLNARPDQLRAWAEKRRAPLPVNPTITK